MGATFDTETIRLMTLFENVTGASVKDCLVDSLENTAYFIVREGDAGIAIGKNGTSVKKVERLIQKTIKVFEFSDDLTTFVKKLIPQTDEVQIRPGTDEIVVEIRVKKTSKAMVIGRDGKNLKLFKEFLQRNHNINGLVVR